jgi:hypothetical protein
LISALPQKADVPDTLADFRFVPFADIKTSDLEHRVSVDFGGPIS